jgi:DNA modification methylase
MTTQLLHGDCLGILKTLPDKSVQVCVTSPPYYGLRSYTNDPREIGKEPTPAAYVAALVDVFAEVWRVLRDDGTLWVNMGDGYNGHGPSSKNQDRVDGGKQRLHDQAPYSGAIRLKGLGNKQLLGMPWRVAFALQDAGWILRSDVIWAKPNCMPESVTDRPTRSHEYLFLFAKQSRYFYDADAIREAQSENSHGGHGVNENWKTAKLQDIQSSTLGRQASKYNPAGRNKRTVWTIATRPYSEAHFATMPEALIEPCILAGSAAKACETCGAAWGRVTEQTGEIQDRWSETNGHAQLGGTHTERTTRRVMSTVGFVPRCTCAVNTGAARSVVLDPFAGSGTVLRVADRFQRDAIGIDLNADYIALQEQRTNGVQIELFV